MKIKTNNIIKLLTSYSKWVILMVLICVGIGCANKKKLVDTGTEEKILLIGNSSDPSSLDPAFAQSVSDFVVMRHINDTIIRLNTKTMEAEPWLAEKWEVSKDGLKYTFHFRKDAKWSNGDPLTVGDFVFSYKRILNQDVGALNAKSMFNIKNAKPYYLREITDFEEVGIKKIDDYTLEITLESPQPYFVQSLVSMEWMPVHPETVKKFGAEDKRDGKWTRLENIVLSGPFIIKRMVTNSVVELEKNPQHWNNHNTKINGVRLYSIANSGVEEKTFRAEQLHVTAQVPVDQIRYYKDNQPAILRDHDYLGTYFYLFNHNIKPLDDVRVRKALSMSVNKDEISKVVLQGYRRPASCIVAPGINGYTCAYARNFNVDLAKQLLAEAGYPDGKGFPKLEISTNATTDHQKIAEAIQQMWNKYLNIDVEIKVMEWNVFLDTLKNHNYQIARIGWIADFYDPLSFLQNLKHSEFANEVNWDNKEYDRILEEASKTGDLKKRYELYRKAELLALNAAAILPIYYYSIQYLVHKDVKHWDENSMNLVYFDQLELIRD